MLRYRLLLGTLIVGALVALCVLDARATKPGMYLLPLALVAAALGSGEFARLAGGRLAISRDVLHAGNVAVVLANWAPLLAKGECPLGPFGAPAIVMGLTMAVAFVDEIRRYEGPGRATERLAATALGLAYVGGLMTFVVQLRMWASTIDGGWGLVALVSLILVVKMCDTGAYTVGRLIGSRKLAPKLSPGKTIEGSLGGIAFACLGAWFAFAILAPLAVEGAAPIAWPRWLAYGLVVGLAGMLGDLAESLLKRDAGQKDSSAWMPGFGGVLDILDSILLAAPVAYLFWAMHWVGP